MRRLDRLPTLALLLLAGCAVRSKDHASPTAPSPPAPSATPATKNCAADVAAVESTGTRMAFRVENRSLSAKTGTIRELRLLFTAARCPAAVEGPAGWSGAIDAQAPKHYCEVAWVTTGENGVAVGTKRDGFAATFRRGKKERPSWAVFLNGCAVGGPATSGPR
jgi:hypothetical protein